MRKIHEAANPFLIISFIEDHKVIDKIIAHLSNKHLYHVVFLLSSPNLCIVLGTPYILEGEQIAEVVEKKVVGDRGFEPPTSTVCKRHKFWSHFGHSCTIEGLRLKGLKKV